MANGLLKPQSTVSPFLELLAPELYKSATGQAPAAPPSGPNLTGKIASSGDPKKTQLAAGILELLQMAIPMGGAAAPAAKLAKGAVVGTGNAKRLIGMQYLPEFINSGYSKISNIGKGYSILSNGADYALFKGDKIVSLGASPEDLVKSTWKPAQWPEVLKTLPKAHQQTWGQKVTGEVVEAEFPGGVKASAPRGHIYDLNVYKDKFLQSVKQKGQYKEFYTGAPQQDLRQFMDYLVTPKGMEWLGQNFSMGAPAMLASTLSALKYPAGLENAHIAEKMLKLPLETAKATLMHMPSWSLNEFMPSMKEVAKSHLDYVNAMNPTAMWFAGKPVAATDAEIAKFMEKNPGASILDVAYGGKAPEPKPKPTKKSSLASPAVGKFYEGSEELANKLLKPFSWANYKLAQNHPAWGTLPQFASPEAFERAKAAGFKTDLQLYKGGYKDYPEFINDPRKKGYEQGFFLADDPNVAKPYASGQGPGGGVLPYVARAQNPLRLNWPEFSGGRNYNSVHMDRLIKVARERKADMLLARHMDDLGPDDHNQYVAIRPNILRAPKAAFDPEKLSWPAPLAALGGLVVLGANGEPYIVGARQ